MCEGVFGSIEGQQRSWSLFIFHRPFHSLPLGVRSFHRFCSVLFCSSLLCSSNVRDEQGAVLQVSSAVRQLAYTVSTPNAFSLRNRVSVRDINLEMGDSVRGRFVLKTSVQANAGKGGGGEYGGCCGGGEGLDRIQ